MGEVEKGDQETEGCAEHWSGFNRDRERESAREGGREGGAEALIGRCTVQTTEVKLKQCLKV